jgi:hypothetical protein
MEESVLAAAVGQRLEGERGLADFLGLVQKRHSENANDAIVVFDYDRTLTSGFSTPDTPTFLRIRGGKPSFQAICQLCLRKFVLTARPVSKSTIKTLVESDPTMKLFLDAGALSASGDMYRADIQSPTGSSTVPIMSQGSIYASDYNKSATLAYIIARAWPSSSTTPADGQKWVYFIDDNANNAFEADLMVRDILLTHYGHAYRNVRTRGIWWDPYCEEFGKNSSSNDDGGLAVVEKATLRPAAQGSDFSLNDEYAAACRHFGIGNEERRQRLSRYKVVWTERSFQKTLRDEKVVQKKIGKVTAPVNFVLPHRPHASRDD